MGVPFAAVAALEVEPAVLSGVLVLRLREVDGVARDCDLDAAVVVGAAGLTDAGV